MILVTHGEEEDIVEDHVVALQYVVVELKVYHLVVAFLNHVEITKNTIRRNHMIRRKKIMVTSQKLLLKKRKNVLGMIIFFVATIFLIQLTHVEDTNHSFTGYDCTHPTNHRLVPLEYYQVHIMHYALCTR